MSTKRHFVFSKIETSYGKATKAFHPESGMSACCDWHPTDEDNYEACCEKLNKILDMSLFDLSDRRY